MKKRWIVFSILAGLLAAGLAGGAVLAHGGGGKGQIFMLQREDSTGDSVLGRVAEILGIEQEQVEDAFDQAITEQAEQKTADRLAALVEKGFLSQEDADAIQDWLSARPESVFPVTRGFEAWGRGHLGKSFGGFGGEMDEKAAGWLDKLVEMGHLTQEQADAYQAWLDDMPEVDFPSFEGKDGYGERGDWRHGKEGYGFGGKR